MTPAQRYLTWFLRVVGSMSLLALVAVFMPRGWMAACHEALGLGRFPPEPVAEYLARSLSMFYAALGAVLWILSRDVRRSSSAILILAVLTLAGGVTLIVIDMRSYLPWWWIAAEGPLVVAMGSVMLGLVVKVRAESPASPGSPSPTRNDAGGLPSEHTGA